MNRESGLCVDFCNRCKRPDSFCVAGQGRGRREVTIRYTLNESPTKNGTQLRVYHQILVGFVGKKIEECGDFQGYAKMVEEAKPEERAQIVTQTVVGRSRLRM